MIFWRTPAPPHSIDFIDIFLILCAGSHNRSPIDPGLEAKANWLIGEFGTVDLAKGAIELITFCPGYLRGLAFMGNVAVAGMSLPRNNKTFADLALDDALEQRKMNPRAGIVSVR